MVEFITNPFLNPVVTMTMHKELEINPSHQCSNHSVFFLCAGHCLAIFWTSTAHNGNSLPS